MRKIVIILTTVILAFVSASCEKEVETNYENLKGKWKSKNNSTILDFFSETELYRVSLTSNDTLYINYSISDDGRLNLHYSDYTTRHTLIFVNKRKMQIYELTGNGFPGDSTYFEYTKMIIQ